MTGWEREIREVIKNYENEYLNHQEGELYIPVSLTFKTADVQHLLAVIDQLRSQIEEVR